MTDLLRERMGFDGVVFTDDLTMGAVSNTYGMGESAVLAVEAGCDVLLVCHGRDNLQAAYEALLDAVESAIEVVRPEAQRQIKTRMFYPYISDSSFMAVCDDTLAIQALETNMPQYGVKYTHPVDKIRQIDVPVVNIGTFGRDGHMLTERVDMRQTFQNVPNITYETVKRLLS